LGLNKGTIETLSTFGFFSCILHGGGRIFAAATKERRFIITAAPAATRSYGNGLRKRRPRRRIDQIAESINELYLKVNRPGSGSGWATADDEITERKSARSSFVAIDAP
jgi:hypothetical protein